MESSALIYIGISGTEIASHLPNVNECTEIIKLLVQLILLIVAIFQALELWKKQRRPQNEYQLYRIFEGIIYKSQKKCWTQC